MNIEETYESTPQESEGVHFEIALERHVALDVHILVQKWNSYCFVSISYHGLLRSFEELNFGIMGQIRENCENYVSQKLGAIQCKIK